MVLTPQERQRELDRFDARLKEIEQEKRLADLRRDRRTRLKLEKERQTLSRFREKVRAGSKIFGRDVTFDIGKQRAQERVTKRFAPKAKKKEVQVLATVKEQVLAKDKPIITKRKELVATRVKVSDTKPKGEIKPGKKQTLEERLSREARLAKFEQKPAKAFVKRASADTVGAITGTISLAKTISDATFRPQTKQGKVARNKLKSAFSLTTLQQAGVAIGRDLQSNDAYEKTRGVLSILSFAVGVPFAKTLKPISTATKVNNKVDLVTGKANTNLRVAGVLEDGRAFTQTGNLKFNPKTKKLTGKIRTKFEDGKIKVEGIELTDKGKFFVDNKGKKISKVGIKPKDTRISIKETSIKQKAPDNIRIFEGNTFKIGKRTTKVKETRIGLRDGKVTGAATKVRKSEIDFAKVIDSTDKKLSETVSLNRNFDVGSAFGKTKKQRDLIDRQIKNFLIKTNFKQKQAVLEQLTLQFKNKQKPKLIKDLELKLKGDVAIYKSTKGKIKSSAEFEELLPTWNSLGISKPKFKNGFLSPAQQKALLKVPDRITIPKLKVRLKSLKRIRSLGLIPVALSTRAINNVKAQEKSYPVKNERKTKKGAATKESAC